MEYQVVENLAQKAYSDGQQSVEEILDWYLEGVRRKRWRAKWSRMLALVIGACAAVMPTVGEWLDTHSANIVKPGLITTLLIAVAGLLIAVDKFFGYSESWMRYARTLRTVRGLNEAHKMEFMSLRATWAGGIPTEAQAAAAIRVVKDHLVGVHAVVSEETNKWIEEFGKALKSIEEAAEKQVAPRPGGLNLSIGNYPGNGKDWRMGLEGEQMTPLGGGKVARTGLAPGMHRIIVEGKHKDTGVVLRVELAVTVVAAVIAEVQMDLP